MTDFARIYGTAVLKDGGSWDRPRYPPFSVVFRCKLVLMIFNQYAYGNHIQDPRAFILRARGMMRAFVN